MSEKIIDRKILRSAINKIVSENSGDIKFLNLLIKVSDEIGVKRFLDENDFEKEIRENMPYLGILEYGMEMGNTQRIKMFIYNKLRETPSV